MMNNHRMKMRLNVLLLKLLSVLFLYACVFLLMNRESTDLVLFSGEMCFTVLC